eukprot:comp23156_c0_seq1/m.37446 comp23156_c0_seq1/g.37446  ORF comp23156_c0_seq1/g.37446 comp23156_c0_seq1/m.37446 type:complete len:387 (-) comp23156_c0_seq1:551-1711(-)
MHTNSNMAQDDHIPDFATLAIHADDDMENGVIDIAPPLHVSTTFKYPKDIMETGDFEYSREDQPTRRRAEKVLGRLEAGEKGRCILYASGLAAIQAVVLHVAPKRVACRGGYHGSIGVFNQNKLEMIDIDDEYQPGDLVWIETPRNASCDVYDIRHYSEKAHAAGAKIAVDSTFAPPPLQYPLQHGADYVMHSTTKFFMGHSDGLGGAVIVDNEQVHHEMFHQRTYMGNMIGNLECWLLLRSVRSLSLRVNQQSNTAEKLAKALESHPRVTKVMHPSLPSHPNHEVAKRQMKGYGGVFAIELESQEIALALPFRTKYFRPATSLGGVESLVDYRYRWDKGVSKNLLRLSIGLEAYEDLLHDLTQALDDSKHPPLKSVPASSAPAEK